MKIELLEKKNSELSAQLAAAEEKVRSVSLISLACHRIWYAAVPLSLSLSLSPLLTPSLSPSPSSYRKHLFRPLLKR